MNKRKYIYKDSDRFFSNLSRSRSCWFWIGNINKSGYGYLQFRRKHYRAHRVSWILHYGEIQKGFSVLHKCDVKKCVNPKHLYIGTQLDNIRDAKRKGRLRFNLGEKNHSSKLTGKQVLQIRKQCKERKIPLREIARNFNIAYGNLCHIMNRETWKHV